MYKNLVRALACTASRPLARFPRLGALARHGSALLLMAAGAATANPAATPTPAPLKVGFVYVSPIGDAGWTFQHEQGRRAMVQALGDQVRTTVVERVAEGPDSERVMRDLAAQGHRLIFATSFGYLEPALKVAAEFPELRIEHMGGHKTAANVNVYNARFYEGRYLAGVTAGHLSRSGQAGYVAGFPIPEVIQGINAFTLGMRSVNPKAEVKVLWLNTWFDPAKEREAALSLLNQGVDVLTHHSGSTAIPALAEEKGVMLMGYQSDMRHVAPTAQMTSVTHVWGEHYTRVVRSMLEGTWKVQPFWGGLKDGIIRLAPFSPKVPAAAVQDVRRRERDIAAGKLHPFGGRLVDQAGAVRQAGGTMADADIARMDWFVQGVGGTLPR